MRISDWSSDVCSSDLHGLGLADEAGQALGAAGSRDGADGDLRLPELGGVCGDDEVAHHRQFAAAAERVTGHRQIGRASGRERVCQYVYISVVAVSLKKKKH